MIFGVGIDLCDAGRLEKKFGEAELSRPCIFAVGAGPAGILRRKATAETAAANFAAKEAFLKAAGTGLGGFAMPELAVLRQKSGAPYFCPDRRSRCLGQGAGPDRSCQPDP